MPRRRLFAALAAAAVAATIAAGSPVLAADPAQPVRLAVAVPLTAPAGSTGLIDAESLEQYTSPGGMLARQLDAVAASGVAVGVDPMVIASIRVLGTAAPASAAAWLERLAGLPNQTIQLAYADLDVSLAAQAGADRIPGPISFAGLDPALFVDDANAPGPGAPNGTAPTPGPTPSPTPPEDDGLPTTEELLAWPYTHTTLAWPRADTVVTGDLEVLAASGYEQVVLASGNVSGAAPTAPIATIGPVTALIADQRVSAALSAAVTATDDAAWAGAIQELYAALDAAALAQPGDRATVFAALDRAAPIVGSRLLQTLRALDASGEVTSITVSAALGTAPVGGELVDKPHPAGRVALAGLALDAATDDRRLARVAANPDAIAGPRQLALLGLLSNAWAANPTGWSAAAGEFVTTSTQLQSAVRIESTSQINFFAEKSVIPIPVTNDLPEPVTVFLTVDANTPLLAVEEPRIEVQVPPNSQASVQVPVQALSNGQVTLRVGLLTADGQQLGPIQSVKVNVAAGWEGPVFTVLAALVVIMFAIGILRTVLRRRGTARDD